VGKKYSLEALTGELLEGETKRSIKGVLLSSCSLMQLPLALVNRLGVRLMT
jgi:hypothetical protein